MKKGKLTGGEQSVNKVSFAEGLRQIKRKELVGDLSDQEKARFERERFAEEEAKKRCFVLGRQIGPIN